MTDAPLIHLVDDDDAIRHSASFMLRHAGFRVTTYPDGADFIDAVDEAEPGCVLLDVQMPRMDGLTVLDRLNEKRLTLPVVVLTAHGDVSVAVRAMKAGAADFLEKPFDKQSLLDALKNACERLDEANAAANVRADAERKLGALTGREREVLACLADGKTNKMVAAGLGISPRTVEVHRANLMEKLGANSLSAALRIAFSAGLGGTAAD